MSSPPIPVVAGRDVSAGAPGDVEALLALALSQPQQAASRAHAVLAGHPDPATAAVAHQAIGIVLRDSGRVPAALRELRAALRLARTAGARHRVIDVSATFGAALVMAGRSHEGLTYLDGAVAMAGGGLLARVRLRRAHVLSLLGRHTDALHDLQLAHRTVRRNGDVLWEALVVINRCLVHLALGAVDRADDDAADAERLYTLLGNDLEAVHATHNRGLVALRRGDLPVALGLFDAVSARYDRLGVVEARLVIDRSQAFLVAGLATDASTLVEGFLDGEKSVQPVIRSELLQTAATAALAAGQIAVARRRASSARRLFAAQQRLFWEARAEFVALQAAYAAGRRDGRLLAGLVDLARRLDELHCEDAPLASLLAGRLALDRGDAQVAAASLAEAGRHRHRGPALLRATGWLAVALEADGDGRGRRVGVACRRGLDALDEHRLAFGGTELRARATGHGRELATLALRHALQGGRPRHLVVASERWRATATAAPALRPPDDPELSRDLAALRDATRRAEEATTAGRSTAPADRDRVRWETAVRQRRMKVPGRGGSVPRFDVDALFAAMAAVDRAAPAGRGGTRAVVLVEVDGILHALTAGAGRVCRHEVGPVAAALREAEFARFSLRAAAYGRRVTPLGELGDRLQRALLGPAGARVGSGSVVVVPPASLHAVPWGLLPALAGVPLTVSPSLSIWMRALARPAPPDRRVALVLGPGLSGAEAETAALRDLHRDVDVLSGARATADRALAGLDGAWLAHIAAHGTFRADSPLFSSLTLEDGPLTVHDLDRLAHPPYRMLLSACDVGGGEAVGSDELLGLVTSLLGLGTTGVMASVVAVNDRAAVAVMVRVHTELAAGRGLADAWLAARVAAAADPLAAATAASFTAWGV